MLPNNHRDRSVRLERLIMAVKLVYASTYLEVSKAYAKSTFHNITSLGISYLTTSNNGNDFIDWKWLQSLPIAKQTAYLSHVKLESPLTIKIDGKKSTAVIFP